MANNPRRLSSLLGKTPHLDHLVRMLRQQQALLREIQTLLPPPLDRHCLHARVSGDSLVIHVDSPAWASKMRFHAQILLQAARDRAPNLKKVSVRILQPVSGQPGPSKPARHKIPSLVEAIDDEELRRLLEERKS